MDKLTPEMLGTAAQKLFEAFWAGVKAGRKSCTKHYGPHSVVEMPQTIMESQQVFDASIAAWETDRRKLERIAEMTGIAGVDKPMDVEECVWARLCRIEALERERVAYFKALCQEDSYVIERVARRVIDNGWLADAPNSVVQELRTALRKVKNE